VVPSITGGIFMLPDVGLIAANKIEWDAFRSTLDKVLKLRPEQSINSCPISFSEDAKYLLNIAAFYGWDIDKPLNVLRNVPPIFMSYLHYTLFIACDHNVYEEWTCSMPIIKRNILDDTYLLLVTGSLDQWYETIILNLNRDWEFKYETRVMLNKLMVFFERDRGLNHIFPKKKVLPDHTWLLE
jgi:hypothetical protein